MAIIINDQPGGATFALKVQAGAGRTALNGEWAGALKIKVGRKPENGAANAACLDFLADLLAVARRNLVIIKGEFSQQKVIRVEGLNAGQVQSRLAAYRQKHPNEG